MANDLTALQTLISGDLSGLGGITNAQILTDIKSAIRDYEAYRFYFNERAISKTISQTSTYALSLFAAASGATVADIIEVDDLAVTVNSNVVNLREISYDEYGRLAINTSLTGIPTRYAIYGQNVYLYPTPNSTYLSNMSAHVSFVELASGSDANAWTADARELIRCATLKRIYARLNQYPEMAAAMMAGEQAALASLQRRTDALGGNSIEGWL